MANGDLLQAGLWLMFVGIGFVMIFLLILIYAIQLMSQIINRFFPEPTSEVNFSKTSSTLPPNDVDHLRPAIVAAVLHHHQRHNVEKNG